jgi:uncharacterized protein
MNRQGDYIETYTGIKFYPLDPRLDEICIEDIAHSLSLQCRFNGHCDIFYSVAEHSVRCLHEFRKLAGIHNANPHILMRVLLHDSAESFLCDIPRPLKPYLKGYDAAENLLLGVIYEKFGINVFSHSEAPLFESKIDPDDLLKEVDLILLATEALSLGMNVSEWNLPFPPLKEQIIPWTSRKSEDAFLSHFKTLQELINV